MGISIKRVARNEETPPGEGDFGVRRVKRGQDQRFESNSEYSIVLPNVDKVAILSLASIELSAVLTESAVWSPELHFAAIGAIAGLGGYSMVGQQAVNRANARRSDNNDESKPSNTTK